MLIEVNNKTSAKINKRHIKKILQKAASIQKLPDSGELSVALVNQNKIKNLNKKYRQKNKATTILSFPYLPKRVNPKKFKNSENFLGELILCYPEISRQAKKRGVSIYQELNQILVHGFLHLLGYDHQTTGEEKKMLKEENKIRRLISEKNN